MAKGIIDGEKEEDRGYPIQPLHIDCKQHFSDAFSTMATEISARYIVGLCQKNGSWHPFTQEEIDKYSKKNFNFYELILLDPYDENNYVILGQDGRYRVTREFIINCFKSSPAI